jgi:hypothetical protein
MQGLADMFVHLGSVPQTIHFDNLSPAVKKILPNGEQQLTEEFSTS